MTVAVDHSCLRRDALAILLPDCKSPEEQDLRNRLLVARDVATANLGEVYGHARHLNLMIVETAGAFVFAPASLDELRLAVRHCRNLIRCAAGAELLGCA